MSKIIIYDNKNILIANLDKTETKRKKHDLEIEGRRGIDLVYHNQYSAIFTEYKILHSVSLRKQLKKVEKILKYHREEK